MTIDVTNVRSVAVLAIGLVAVITDLRTRRIPNALTFGAAGAALLYAGFTGGTSGLLAALAGWFVGAALFFPLFALRGMGAGDVKLLAALGAWVGPAEAVWLAIFSSIAGGALAVMVSLYHGYLRRAAANVWFMLMHWRAAGIGPVPGFTLKDASAPRLAYAVPIAIGVVCTLWRR
jgi:prepilin peptidase CpaA